MAGDFIFENFCRPIIDSSVQGYNLVNTSIYALILFAIVFYGLYPFLKKNKIEFNYKFMLAILPFVFFGSAFRVLNDTGLFSKTCNVLDFGFYTFTPGIWILIAAITLASLFVAKKYSTNEEGFHKILGGMGLVFLLPLLAYHAINFLSWEGFAMALGLMALVTILTRALVGIWKKDFFSDHLNTMVVAGQAMDGASTFVATSLFSCGEQHPLSEFILGANPFLFILVKIALAVLIIHYVDNDVKDKNFAGFIKVAVTILGFATGTRNLITLGAGTCL
ncbi:MAG: DUF63 family protein [archaeon]|nr:DUF63 family protein [archaeon]